MPSPFPVQFSNYPHDPLNGNKIKYAIPFFFKIDDAFKSLELDYMLGIGVEKDQV